MPARPPAPADPLHPAGQPDALPTPPAAMKPTPADPQTDPALDPPSEPPSEPPDAGPEDLAPWRRPEFREGMRDMSGVALGIGAWGLVTGVAMVKLGLSPAIAVLMSVTVFAGTAQIAVAPLMATGAPLWVVWATALCLNLRFVIFGAQMRPFFTDLPFARRVLHAYFCADLNYVLMLRRFPQPAPGPQARAYFWGGVMMNAGAWHVLSLVGIALGDRVPEHWGLGFAGTLALLGMTYSMLGDRRTWLPTLAAAAAAVLTRDLPLKLNLLVAIACAIAAGMLIDRAPGSGRVR